MPPHRNLIVSSSDSDDGSQPTASQERVACSMSPTPSVTRLPCAIARPLVPGEAPYRSWPADDRQRDGPNRGDPVSRSAPPGAGHACAASHRCQRAGRLVPLGRPRGLCRGRARTLQVRSRRGRAVRGRCQRAASFARSPMRPIQAVPVRMQGVCKFDGRRDRRLIGRARRCASGMPAPLVMVSSAAVRLDDEGAHRGDTPSSSIPACDVPTHVVAERSRPESGGQHDR